ncbi:hypothetical protein IHE45_01G047500 [Dioscorea alata]|uniref:Uncharacterized protein n=1 Tax=Dioscorea alata TaxID=55571 RepID=A0ACB7WUN2_DIOAL|nr:hypothetical protein IHE45_01G047500 [Dioscorea alata]
MPQSPFYTSSAFFWMSKSRFSMIISFFSVWIWGASWSSCLQGLRDLGNVKYLTHGSDLAFLIEALLKIGGVQSGDRRCSYG